MVQIFARIIKLQVFFKISSIDSVHPTISPMTENKSSSFKSCGFYIKIYICKPIYEKHSQIPETFPLSVCPHCTKAAITTTSKTCTSTLSVTAQSKLQFFLLPVRVVCAGVCWRCTLLTLCLFFNAH